jgi:transposase
MTTLPAGLEVSAESLAACLADPERGYVHRHFRNTLSGHRQLARWLTRHGKPVRVCLEATGTYSLDVAMRLHQTAGIEVLVANPRAARRFAQALMRRAKTDRTDAEVLCEFAARMPGTPWQPPRPEALELRALTRRLYTLTQLRSAEKNRLHAARRTVVTPRELTASIQRTIRHLTRERERLETQIEELIHDHEWLLGRYRLLLSIRGVGSKSAAQILAELATLPDDLNPRQWVAHAGLDPRPRESGSSVHKPRRISKNGNAILRQALYMPALVASRHDPLVHAFYQQLLDKGRLPRQALVAIMRKLLHATFGIWRHQAPYDNQKLFPNLQPATNG